MIFGGKDHNIYLGCLNCSEFEKDSVYNQYGPYGSEFSKISIYNHFGPFGSSFSDLSPCNPFANYPPVVVDQDGNFYGYLTLNEFHHLAIRNPKILKWLRYICNK